MSRNALTTVGELPRCRRCCPPELRLHSASQNHIFFFFIVSLASSGLPMPPERRKQYVPYIASMVAKSIEPYTRGISDVPRAQVQARCISSRIMSEYKKLHKKGLSRGSGYTSRGCGCATSWLPAKPADEPVVTEDTHKLSVTQL